MEDRKKVTINDNEYIIYKMNALQQFEVLRKLTLLLKDLDNFNNEASLLNLLSNIGNLPKQDSDFIIFSCLDKVRFTSKDGKDTVPISDNNKILRSDIDVFVMLEIITEVVKFNFENFTRIKALLERLSIQKVSK